VNAFHFTGGNRARLLGIHDAPPDGEKRAHGIVLCHPVAHEYMAAYRTLRIVARELALRGFDVLRFDYQGTGDSAGDLDEGSLDLWREDTLAAMGCLRNRTGLERLSLVGLRLGGSIAARAAARSGSVDSLALWSPVIRGSEQMEAVRDHRAEWERDREVDNREVAGRVGSATALEFPLGTSVEEELPALDLATLEGPKPRRMLWVLEEGEAPGPIPVRGFLAGAQRRTYPVPSVWRMGHGLERRPVPIPLIRGIADWLRED